MALITAYLAHTARRRAVSTTASAARSFFTGLKAFFRTTAEALSEAQELRRVMARKQPFIDT